MSIRKLISWNRKNFIRGKMISQKNTVRVLILNPNSSKDMTHGIEEAIRSIGLPKVSDIAGLSENLLKCYPSCYKTFNLLSAEIATSRRGY